MILFSRFRRKDIKSTGKSPSGPAEINPLANTERKGGFIYNESDSVNEKDDATYQLKESNSTKRLRKFIRYDPNPADTIGEFFASVLGERFLNRDIGDDASIPERSPHMELVVKSPLYGDDASQLLIASRYLNDAGERKDKYWIRPLDTVMKKRVDGVKGEGRHAVLVNGDADGVPNGLPLDKEFEIEVEEGKRIKAKISKEQMYDLLAFSAAMGDDDVNPDNFILSINKTPDKNGVHQCTPARIDYGHALLDLRKSLGETGGPKLGKGRGVILDGLNRDKVNGDKSTKFRRDFRGVIPDAEFAASLRRTAEDIQNQLAEGGALDNAFKECKEELEKVLPNREKLKEGYIQNESRKKEARWNKECVQEIYKDLANFEKDELGSPKASDFVQKIKEQYPKEFNNLLTNKRSEFKKELEKKVNEDPALVSKISDAERQANVLKDELGNALRTINHHIGKSPSRGNKGGMSNKELLDNTIENIKDFMRENAEEMKSVANLIEIQSIVDKAAKGEIKGEALKEAQERIHELYNEDGRYLKGKSPSKGVVEWVRTDDDKKPFKGTLEEYINHQRTQLKELAAEKEQKSTSESLMESVETLGKQRGLWAQRGAMAGAAIGAIVGSAFPGFGTVAGAFIGGIVGGVAGYVLPEIAKAGVGIVNFFRDAVNHFRDKKTEPETPVLEKGQKPDIAHEESRSNLKSLRKAVTTSYSPDKGLPNLKDRGNDKNKTPGH